MVLESMICLAMSTEPWSGRRAAVLPYPMTVVPGGMLARAGDAACEGKDGSAPLSFGAFLFARRRLREIPCGQGEDKVGGRDRTLNSLKTSFGANTPLNEITANRISQWQAERLGTISRQTSKLLSPASSTGLSPT